MAIKLPRTRSADVVSKWGEAIADRGFAQLPNYLLFLNQFLDDDYKLSATELLILVQIVAAWWKKDELPFPSMSTLATRCGVSERQVQRSVTRLEELGLLLRVKRRSSGIIGSNAYDLAPLVSILEKVAKTYPNAFPRRIEVGQSAAFFEAPKEPETHEEKAAVRPKIRRIKRIPTVRPST